MRHSRQGPDTPLLDGNARNSNCFPECLPSVRPPKYILISAAAVVVTSASEQVLRKSVATQMFNYRWFLVQLLALGSFLLSCILVAINWKAIKRTTDWPSLPYKSFFYIAFLDTFHAMLLMVAVGALPGVVSILLPQVLIPLSIWFSFCSSASEQSHGAWYLLGSVLVLAGAFIAFIPELLHFTHCWGEGSSHAEVVSNIILMLVGVLSGALCHTYKKSFLTDAPINIWAMNLFTSGFQAILTFILGPLALRLQYLHISGRTAISTSTSGTSSTPYGYSSNTRNIITSFGDGMSCLMGQDTEFGDVCSEQQLAIILQLLGYILSICLLQYALFKIISQSPTISSTLVHNSSIVAVCIAFLIYLIPVCAETLIENIDVCFHVSSLAGGVCLIIGLVLAHPQTTEQQTELDIWAQIEAISGEHGQVDNPNSYQQF